jgi:hypothetical protein
MKSKRHLEHLKHQESQKQVDDKEEFRKKCKEDYQKKKEANLQKFHEERLEKLHQKNETDVEKTRLIYELHICPCGGSFSLNSKCQHIKTKRHLKHLESQDHTVEIKIEQQIIEEQDEIILKQPQILEKEHLSEEKQIHAKMMKEKRSGRLNELHECACGATYSARNKARHMKSKSHAKCLEVEKCDI